MLGGPGALDIMKLPKRIKIGYAIFFDHIHTPELLRARTAQLFDWIIEGRLKVHIGGEYPLAQAAKALADMQSRATTGKLLLIALGNWALHIARHRAETTGLRYVTPSQIAGGRFSTVVPEADGPLTATYGRSAERPSRNFRVANRFPESGRWVAGFIGTGAVLTVGHEGQQEKENGTLAV